MIFGADASNTFPWVAGGSATILLTASVALISRQIASLLRENRRCNRRLGILFSIVVKNKLDIPMEYFDEVHAASTVPLPPKDPKDA